MGEAALVTGGARRIGSTLVRTLAARGADVAIHCNTGRDEGEALAAEIRGLGVRAAVLQADLLDRQATAGLVAAAAGPSAFGTVQWFLATPVGLFMLFGWTTALFWHFYGGIRHLAWDSGYGYDLPQTHASGWATLIATAASTVLVWAAGLWMLRS